MNGIWETGIITVLSFFVLLVLTRLIGKKQLGQLNIFTYITGIVIGNIAGEMIIHRDVDLLEGIFGMAIWSALVYIIELVSLKSIRARILLDGEPTSVILDGIIIRGNLEELGLTVDWLMEQMQAQAIFDVSDVLYAEVQSDHSIIFQKK